MPQLARQLAVGRVLHPRALCRTLRLVSGSSEGRQGAWDGRQQLPTMGRSDLGAAGTRPGA